MKKLLFIIFAFISLTAHAQEMPIGRDQFYSIENFSDMLKSHVSPYLIKDGSATEALNVNANDEYGSISKRNKRLKLSECHAAPVKSLYRFYKSDDSKYIIQTSSTYVDYVSDEGVCTSLYASASDGRRWSWITYKDMAIGMNGTNNAKKWDGSLLATANTDGHRTAGDLITDLGAPFAELNTGDNLDASGWYQYKIAYYDGSTYSFSSSRSNPILTGSSVRNIKLTDIPLGPEGTTQRIIYRTLGNDSRAAVVADTTFYKVAAIADNSTTIYEDAIPDTTIDDNAAPTWATVSAGTEVTPPKSKYS
ncbi:MAG: hypothetical protein EOM87_09130, partial [Clostridia bacterium]|nr:hypothetical protein [Clostridia bacterium]